ncbi:hypothetical protein BV898_16782 [Hypsibius exemplaris]|uniref:Prominin-1-A n=1 Tax=Hypsibius exemplaris TaxID=2072580 RepID=A0A9X6RM57_HYPEX|nr:hypothetical protein BV898_16782 [Hypsibius exemplaris]
MTLFVGLSVLVALGGQLRIAGAAASLDINILIPPPADITFPVYTSSVAYLSQPTAGLDSAGSSSSALHNWYSWEKLFMNAVQPVPLDVVVVNGSEFAAFISNIYSNSGAMARNTTLLLETLNTKQLRGVLIMLAIGIVYVILMPLIGMIWCICRCCCYKGHQTFDKTGYVKQRGCLSLFTFIFTVLICASAIMSYFTGADFMKSTQTINPALQNAFSDMGNLANDARSQINFTTKEGYMVASRAMKAQLEKVGVQFASVILNNLADLGIKSALAQMITLTQSAPNITASVSDIQAQATALTTIAQAVGVQLDALIASIQICTVSVGQVNPCVAPVGSMRTTLTNTKATLSGPSFGNYFHLDLSAQQTLMRQSSGMDVKAIAAYQRLLDLPFTIYNKTSAARNNTVHLLNSFATDLDDYLAPVVSLTESVHEILVIEADNFQGYEKVLKKSASYGNAAVIVLATAVLVMAFMMFLGCSFGLLFFERTVLPTQRKGAVTCGNFCLILQKPYFARCCEVVLTISLCWMVYVASFVASTLHVSSLVVLHGNQSIKPGELLTDCMHDESLFVALNMSSVFNASQIQTRLDDFNILSSMNGLKVDIGDVDVYDATTEAALRNFMDALSFPQFVDYLKLMDASSHPLPYADLETVKTTFHAIPDQQQQFYDDNQAKVDAITANFRHMDWRRTVLVTSVQTFMAAADKLLNSAIRAKGGAEDSRSYFTLGTYGNASADLASAATLFAQRTYSIAQRYVAHLNDTVENDVAPCRPVYQAVESVTNVLCDEFLSPLNGFWSALGVALMVFIPAVFTNCCLAKYYQRANGTDLLARRATFTERRRQLTQVMSENPLRTKTWKVEGEKWKVEKGKWKVESGKWKVEGGRWKVEKGKWKTDESKAQHENQTDQARGLNPTLLQVFWEFAWISFCSSVFSIRFSIEKESFALLYFLVKFQILRPF